MATALVIDETGEEVRPALTDKRQRFVEEYLLDFNAKQAAIRAGYSEKSALMQGSRLLTFEAVKVELTRRRSEIARKLKMTPEGVASELARLAFVNVKDFLKFDPAEPDAPPVDWIYDVVVSRKGTLRLPVKIEVQFTGGDIESFEWTREAQEGTNWWRLPIEPGPNKIKRVLVDPARRYYLDVNMADNQWYSGKDLVAPLRWSERAFTQYAHLLHWYSSLGG